MTAGAPREPEPLDAVARWASSGAAALTGRADGPPLGPPAPLVDRADHVAARLRSLTAEIGRAVEVDPLVLLTERAAIAGLRRAGERSCGGATHLIEAEDGWLAASLARDDDVELLPAWLAPDGVVEDPPAAVTVIASAARHRAAVELAARGAELGLPVSALGEAAEPVPTLDVPFAAELPIRAAAVAAQTPRPPVVDPSGALVVEMASLLAGPLCGSLLAAAGATVVKVESAGRPDGARRGPARFFDLLNGAKRSVALDLAADSDRRRLRALLARADVVIEGSRPRALRHLGIDAAEVLSDGTGAWVSITSHGRGPATEHRVGFGDDAAVAGGLVAWEDGRPRFVADAIADPLTGLVAATAVVGALAAGGNWLLDVALARVAAHHAGPTLDLPADLPIAAPRAPRPSPVPAPALGADTESVLATLDA